MNLRHWSGSRIAETISPDSLTNYVKYRVIRYQEKLLGKWISLPITFFSSHSDLKRLDTLSKHRTLQLKWKVIDNQIH